MLNPFDINAPDSHTFRRIADLSFTLGLAAAVTTAVLIMAGAPPLDTYYHLFKGALGSMGKLAQVLRVWVPLTLCGLGLLFTFRIGLWNIGIEGQIIAGAIFTTAAVRWGAGISTPALVLGLALLSGWIGGALWAIISGLLKTRGGVHEIFAGLGLNFVAQGWVLWLIFGPWKRPGVASMSGTEVFPEAFWLPYFSGFRVSPVGIIMVIMGLIGTILLLRFSRFGLHLKAVGSNRNASILFGLRPDRFAVLAMALAGGMAGLAGGLQVSGVYHRLIPSISSNYGYLALLVVMLADYRIWAVPAVAFFFACLNVGSVQLPMVLQLDSSLSGVIQGTLVLSALGIHAWRGRRTAAPLTGADGKAP